MMHFLSACHTSTGVHKSCNQDALLLQHADTPNGTVVLAVVCDGLGGLKRGEVASAAAVRSFSDWFQYIYPEFMTQVNISDILLESWYQMLALLNKSIQEYGVSSHLEIGTTVEALLLTQRRYYILHVGDCRVYCKDTKMKQLTKDQTYLQQQVDRGLMTQEQAAKDLRGNVILQCVGASRYLEPDFLEGEIRAGQSFLLCSDGFRHMQSVEEISDGLVISLTDGEAQMEERLLMMTARCRKRGEEDDISSIWVQVRD